MIKTNGPRVGRGLKTFARLSLAALALGAITAPALAAPKPYLLFESRADRPSGSELYLHSWDSVDDLYTQNSAYSASVFIDVAPSYQIAGFDIYDGKPYLLFESRADQPSGSEL